MSHLKCLKVLILCHNSISKLDGLSSLSSLETLDVSENMLRTLAGLEGCKRLSKVVAAKNSLASVGDLRSCEKLKVSPTDRSLTFADIGLGGQYHCITSRVRSMPSIFSPNAFCGSEPHGVPLRGQVPGLVGLCEKSTSCPESLLGQ